MFPLRDENPCVRIPWVTGALIAINALAWIAVQGLGHPQLLMESICRFGLVPGALLGHIPPGSLIPLGSEAVCRISAPVWPTLLTSMFMHGGWFHIIANLWFLWIFGDNVEDAMGPWRFLLFYLLCGLGAAAVQIATDPAGQVPMVGASGAISGVMGAYALLYPHARIHTLVVFGFYVTIIALPAWLMLGYWFLIQLIGGIPALSGAGGGVAFWAHVGGFVTGIALIGAFRDPRRLAERRRTMLRRRSGYR